MAENTPPPTSDEIQSLLDKLLPPNEEMDHLSALLVINRAGVDHDRYTRTESQARSQGPRNTFQWRCIPPDLIKVIEFL
jgi:hypothetical protein